jgi:hypothetical protein
MSELLLKATLNKINYQEEFDVQSEEDIQKAVELLSKTLLFHLKEGYGQ